jgi:hypothetical protein
MRLQCGFQERMRHLLSGASPVGAITEMLLWTPEDRRCKSNTTRTRVRLRSFGKFGARSLRGEDVLCLTVTHL